MQTIKNKGYVLFEHREKLEKDKSSTDVVGYYDTIEELNSAHFNALDDKWDWEYRNKIHYFYLNCSTNTYQPMNKWLNDYDDKLKFNQCEKKKLSTKIF
jgi:hypothetical protein